MKLTNDQNKAYDDIMKWMAGHGEWCYRLAGFAGTGKTTLLQHIVNSLDEAPYCCAPTGKAASVLASKLHDEAIVTTVHKLLYSPVSPCTEELENLISQYKDDKDNEELKLSIEIKKQEIANEKLCFSSKIRPNDYLGNLIFVDEGSMLTSRMAKDFELSGARVLVIGDPGQLPAVGDVGWFESLPAHSTLQQITRQALESPIIRLSMEIRENGFCNPKNYKNSEHVNIVSKGEIDNNKWTDQDQVLTGSNYLRRRINRFFRKNAGINSKLPVQNEKLICLKNDLTNYGFINGILSSALQDFYVDGEGQLRGSILFEDQVKAEISFYDYPFNRHYDKHQQEEPWAMRQGLAEFDWAYAITVHKAQGSEWNNVLLADDGFWINKPEQRRRWLYTGITRAKENFTWVQD